MEIIEISVERYEELLKAEQNGVTEIKIPVSRYEELVKKEAAYDMFRGYQKEDGYVTDMVRILFNVTAAEEA